MTDVNRWVYVILGSDGMRCQKISNFVGGEPSITHTCEDLIYGILRFRDGLVRRREGEVGTACEELQTRTANAVRNTNSTGELNTVRNMRMCE